MTRTRCKEPGPKYHIRQENTELVRGRQPIFMAFIVDSFAEESRKNNESRETVGFEEHLSLDKVAKQICRIQILK